MEVEVIEGYYIRSDIRQWILSQKMVCTRGKNKGKVYWNDIGFYRDIKHLLRDLLQLSVRLKDGKTLDELIQYTTEVKEALKKAYEGFSDFDKYLEGDDADED